MKLRERIEVLLQSFSRRAEARYQSRHRFIGFIAKRFGTRVYDPYNNWFESPEWCEIWRGSDWQANEIDVRKFSLYHLLRLIKGIPGDTAECGAYTGLSSYAILSATRGDGRHHHVFDSFAGLSAPTEEDAVSAKFILKWRKNDLSAPESVLKQSLAKFPNVHVYKGWIPERFDEVSSRRFAFLHVDVDLYQPTLDSLQFFYPRLVENGLIVCDDYGFSSCPGAYRAMNDYAAEVGSEVVHLPTGQGLLMKRSCSTPVKTNGEEVLMETCRS